MVRRFIGSLLSIAALVALFGMNTAAVRADPRDFTLVNASGSAIYYIYVSPTDTSDWEEDVLGSDVLMSGSSVNITFSRFTAGRCFYDIKVVTGDSREGYLWNVDLCSTTTVTFR
jgi:hypothetical protein